MTTTNDAVVTIVDALEAFGDNKKQITAIQLAIGNIQANNSKIQNGLLTALNFVKEVHKKNTED